MKIKFFLFIFSLLIFTYCKNQNKNDVKLNIDTKIEKDTIKESEDVIYKITGESFNKGLTAIYDNTEKVLISEKEEICFDTLKVADFDGNGYQDVLLEISPGCGGNCCGYEIQIIGFDGNKFYFTESFGNDWDGLEYFEKNGKYFFVVDNFMEGVGNTDFCNNKTDTFSFDGKKLVLEGNTDAKKLNALVELLSRDLVDVIDSYIIYDLDEDGLSDTIFGSYWDRWGSMFWSVKFGDGKNFSSSVGYKRIGVLQNKTKGVHDLVADCNDVLVWNGKEYVEKK